MTDHTQTIHSKDKGSFANASLDLSTHDNSEVVPRRSSRSRGHSANNSKNFNEETIINDLPLQHLAVYVEVMSNDTNISDTTYKYLEVLGAKIEKRLNLKCNLVIWKDGTLKTVHKAKALGIPIVNSLWLEDCLEKSHCADFEKFTPKLLTNEEWPFVAIPRPKKRKRRSIGLHQADESGSDSKESKKLTSHQTKKLKSKSKSKDQQKEVRVRILWSPTKASRLGNTKSGSKSKEPTRSRRSRPRVSKKSKSPSIRVGALHWRIVRTRTPDLEGLDGVDLEKMDAEKPEPSVSSIENKSPLGPEIQERIRKQHEEQEAIEVRNMIIRYATLSSVQIDRPLSSDKDTDFDELDGFYRRRNFLEESEENKSDFDLSLGSPEEEEKAKPVAPVEPVRVLRSASKSANKSANKDSLLRNPVVPAKGKFEDLQPQSKAKATTRSAAAKTTALKATPISKKDALVTPQTKAGSTVKKTPATPATPECPDCPNNTQVSVLSFMEEEEQEEETPKEELFNSLDLKTRSGSRERGRNKEVSTPVTIIKTRRQSAEEKKSTQRKEPPSAKSSVVAATPKKGSKKKADITPNRTLDTFGFVVKSGTKDKDKDKTPKKMEVEQEDIRGTKILFNSFRRSELMILRGFCEKFELKYLNDAIRSVLDSEMLVFEGNEAPKNYKTALAMALGKPIVKEDWVSESLKADKLLDYRDFEIKYDKDVRKELLAKMKFQVDKEISEMPVNMVTQKDIVTLIEGASGTICYNIKSCDYVVMRKTNKKKTGAPAHVKSVTPQWIIDSVIEGKLLNTDSPAYNSG